MTVLVPRGTRYELIRPLATGGMAEVHLARAVAPSGLTTLVALKRVRPDLPEGEYLPMFFDEVRLAERLRHPNLTYALDTSAACEHRYYVMEYLDGCDVRQLAARAGTGGGTLALDLVVPILLGACAGLHYAHECRDDVGQPLGIVHRDISPANLVVTYDGRVKVIDFGIASYAQRRCETRVGVVKGKVRYLAPEQFLFQPIDRRSDVFALSIVLWELTVGRKPYDSDNDYAVLRAICESDAPKPSSVRPGYPAELEAIVLKGLRRAREERWQSAAELGSALQRFARARGIRATTTEVARRMKPFVAADRAVVSARYRFAPHDGVRLTNGGTRLHRRNEAVRGGDATLVDPVFELVG